MSRGCPHFVWDILVGIRVDGVYSDHPRVQLAAWRDVHQWMLTGRDWPIPSAIPSVVNPNHVEFLEMHYRARCRFWDMRDRLERLVRRR